MVQKESVRERLNNRDQGISYTEFSYMLLQAYDFLHLRRVEGCTVQVAGSDQYGNIVAGIDLIHRELGHSAEAFGVTAPLVTHADGRKIGKSEGGVDLAESPIERVPMPSISTGSTYPTWKSVRSCDCSRLFGSGRDRGARGSAAHGSTRKICTAGTRWSHDGAAPRTDGAPPGGSSAPKRSSGEGTCEISTQQTLKEVASEIPHSEHDWSRLEGEGVPLLELLPSTSLASVAS